MNLSAAPHEFLDFVANANERGICLLKHRRTEEI